jgi:4-hydroxy-tetrahydrodipicolinate synthase
MIKGSIPALVTPFKNGEIDYNSLDKLLTFHVDNGTDAILLLGTTAESPTIATDEKETLLRFCVQRLGSKLPLIAGSGSNNLQQTISATQKVSDMGIEYALIVTPYYNKPNQDGLYLYYKEIVNKTTAKIIIYNVPGRTGCNMAAETVSKLANEFPDRIIGIKDASGDLVKCSKIVRDCPETFVLLSGEDALNFPLICIGGKGTISVTANAVPAPMHKLIKYATDGDLERAKKIHQLMIELNDIMFVDSSPIPVKQVLAHIGLIELEYRLPLCETTQDKKTKIISIYERFISNYQLL